MADPADALDPDLSGQVVSMTFFRFSRWRDRFWAFAQMGLARAPLQRIPELQFFKLMGAGTGEGFTPVPDTGAVAILAVWPDLRTARHRIAEAAVYRAYRTRASEVWTVFLTPRTAWGAWGGQMPFQPRGRGYGGAVVALTRATLKPPVLFRFWRRVPSISRAIGADPNVIFKLGVGELPWLHQMTFSIWPDTGAMAAFARADGPHARAIRAVRDGDWFAEELYARFALIGAEGRWGGRDPLAGLAVPIPA
ncbi:MAG: spheroidene monooxygenase [Pseudomonadota bacterium]